MSKEFKIAQEFEVQASPGEVWAAITTGTAGWLWPVEYEPREGGAAPFGGTVTAWDPPRHLTARVENVAEIDTQTLNELDHIIEPREGGGSWVRYTHSGIFVDDWENQYDGANQHTTFYLHTLRQYLTHFTGRPAVFVSADAPAASAQPGSFPAVARALGLTDDTADSTADGTAVRVELPGSDGPQDAVLDYRDAHFIGLRTRDVMYRFFGRDAFGAPVGIGVHDFRPQAAGVDHKKWQRDWEEWLTGVYAA
ncbi:SRPBCC family protein [Streptomyces zagrosensis]|uniref:SRPBCC domain-containing protein n=1 Tax=Streptomyces zagrosensis TaxID=1042984 RepID=A0A7W9Q679_9ACTN|nr:SRPBCC domain-containing protein [Streptomyces zagrosensis]MBB5934251.1 hypothetical protein [Streptomyces zagrosensis]